MFFRQLLLLLLFSLKFTVNLSKYRAIGRLSANSRHFSVKQRNLLADRGVSGFCLYSSL